jgi:hypothetical protein
MNNMTHAEEDIGKNPDLFSALNFLPNTTIKNNSISPPIKTFSKE